MVCESHIDIYRGQVRLSAIVHFPVSQEPVPIVVIVPGLTGTKVGPHRMLRKISEHLFACGIASIRFDLFGAGESDGAFEDATLQSQILDAEAVLQFAHCDPRVDQDHIGMLGFSMGGIVASLVASQNTLLVKKLALLAPLVTLAPIARRLLSSRPNNQMSYFDFSGNRFGLPFLQDVIATDIEGMAHTYLNELLIVQGTGKGEVTLLQVQDFYRNVYGERGRLVQIEGANHTFDGHLWEVQVLRAVRDFFAS